VTACVSTDKRQLNNAKDVNFTIGGKGIEPVAPMNKLLLSAAILAAITTAVHAFVGGNDVAAPLLASQLGEEPRLTLYAVWHMATVALGLSALAFFVGALPRYAAGSRSMVQFASVLWLAFGAVFVVVAATQPGSGLFFKLPQWVLLVPVGLLGWRGANHSFKPKPLQSEFVDCEGKPSVMADSRQAPGAR